ncbi:PREDICTED: ovochymase-2-like [Nanorana parkeri]|uniref:ovochymase-2-like n=1 Tax=Nanorana parkeri TaxID=125878 RepID=UPI00085497DC|nr:PREDICTED: ovochymase-2-like [Nanorana parkeri]
MEREWRESVRGAIDTQRLPLLQQPAVASELEESKEKAHTRGRCGERPSVNNYSLLSRIVGGTTAKEHDYPWIVSITRKSKHVCGGALVSERHVITAAHCVTDKNITGLFKVCIGDHDFNVKEDSEMVFSILEVIIHPNFLQSQPINYDIAILVLNENIKFDGKIQPACLPSPDEIFPPGYLCVALGWGRTLEHGPVAKILQQVTLPIVEQEACMRTMQTLGPRATFQTAVCAGFPEGGKDACQGDSGGPFLCPRIHGRWVLVGVTSWGMGCARSWSNNLLQLPEKRGSPGIFTDVKKMLEWLNLNLSQARCSGKNQLLRGTSGTLKLPQPPSNYYLNNEKCKWTISVPEGKHILLTFDHFDLEFDYSCDMDYLAVYLENGSVIGKFCGSDRPWPLLITKNEVSLKFISDFQVFRSGFALSYEAVEPEDYSDSQCGSVAVITGEGEIQTINHPGKYSSNADCKWIITCPVSFRIKVTFTVFEVEPSNGCLFDYVLIYHDLEGIVAAGKFCGFSIPKPVESTSNIMQIIFSSDSRVNHIGFRATISFHTDQSIERNPADFEGSNLTQSLGNRVADVETGCVAAPILPMFINQSITVAEEAIPNSWPWHVSLSIGGKHFCSAVIVTNKFVLTAASCIERRRQFLLFLVVAGLHDLDRAEDAQKSSVKIIHMPPGFVSSTSENDIALIQLNKPLQFNDNVQPVCFPRSYRKVKSSSICIVSGWDVNGEGERSTKLQQLEVPLETDGVCESYYGKITGSMLCAGTAKGRAKYTCRGQPGSPLVCPSSDPTAFFIYGIASKGVGCQENAKPGVYTRISVFTEWIQSVIQAESAEVDHHRVAAAQDNPQNSTEDQPDQIPDPQEQPGALSNGSSSQFSYTDCKGVMSMESPGEVKLVADSQDHPDGFSCQVEVQAPADHFIMLIIKELTPSQGHNLQVLIYEGTPSNKTLIAKLTADTIPGKINSTGPALTVEAKTSVINARLQLWLSYTLHSQT